uniref:asparagine synthase (glutamine-hydrolyzing) n=1 Tax=uncultured bacterium lac193 TaxID=1447243 RepID=X2LCN9_9BACT|nr:asparagine synthase [uncultured bacterium lac193]
MIRLLHHRGPDGNGIRVAGASGLAHARLSIIDLAGGAQPLSNEDGTVWISFNGEIYNYVELRADLEARGHRFQTRSDTEVIVHAYEEYGPACLDTFNGQFAFAIWDEKDRTLFVARDRFGKKPLYYSRRPEVFVFGSEIKAVLAHPAVSREIDLTGFDQILTFWCTVPPRTFFADVSELPPGHWLTLKDGVIDIRQYWQPAYGDIDAGRSEADYAEELRALLVDAVRLRMLRSDVPVGAYLSGGLDSTVIAALITRYTDVPLRTFSVAFEDPEFDESSFQRRAAAHLGITDHHEVLCRAEDIGRAFPEVVWHSEQPVIRTAPTPLFLLSRLVREQGYKVVLTGEGSDEILGGYDIFKEAKVRRFCAARPESLLRPKLLKRLYPYLTNLQNQSPAYLQAFFQTRAEDLRNPFFSHLPRWQVTSRIKMLLSDEVRAATHGRSAMDDLRQTLPAAFHGWDPFCQSQYLETTNLLPGYILSSQGDRVQMANSVEGRCPFLDYRIAEFAGRLPPRLKMKVLNEKYILKKAAGDLIPDFLHKRPKQPYRATDVPSFFDTSRKSARFDYVSDLLSEDALRRVGLFNASAVSRLVSRARAGEAVGTRDGMALVAVLSAQLVSAQFRENLGRAA